MEPLLACQAVAPEALLARVLILSNSTTGPWSSSTRGSCAWPSINFGRLYIEQVLSKRARVLLLRQQLHGSQRFGAVLDGRQCCAVIRGRNSLPRLRPVLRSPAPGSGGGARDS